jgi:uncharacterized membrane protein
MESGLMILYFFPPLGKESVIPMGIASGIHPISIALSIAYIDIVVAIFLLWNYDFAKLIPMLGKWIDRVEKTSEKFSKNKPWLTSIEFIGIILFVMIPFQGTGGVGATILGRALSMNRYFNFIAISVGTILGCLFIAYSIDYLKNIFHLSSYFILSIVIIFIIIILMYKSKNKDGDE